MVKRRRCGAAMRGTTVRDPGGLLDLAVIQAADLEALPLPTKRVIEVVGFVDADVDPLLYARPYWVLLREVREQLADWATGLIEAARDAGASWADLAQPLGVASRQAAERRYLCLRPDPANRRRTRQSHPRPPRRQPHRGRLGPQQCRRPAPTRRPDHHPHHLPANAHAPIEHLHQALADNGAANLLAPLAATAPHLQHNHPDLATRIETLTRHAEQLRHHSNDQPRTA